MNGRKKGCVCRMVIDREEYKKVNDALCRSHGKISKVRWYFAMKQKKSRPYSGTGLYKGFIEMIGLF